ncbi:MAG: hypothetical protein ABI693_25305 [Bryobacteraceae bacterium]
MSESRYFFVPECVMRSLVQFLRIELSLSGVFQSLSRLFTSRRVVLLAAVLGGYAVRVRGAVVQLGGSLVIFVV